MYMNGVVYEGELKEEEEMVLENYIMVVEVVVLVVVQVTKVYILASGKMVRNTARERNNRW